MIKTIIENRIRINCVYLFYRCIKISIEYLLHKYDLCK